MLGTMGRWLSYLLLGLLLIVLVVFTLLPLAARWGVAYWFEQQGADARLQHLSIAPVAGRIELAGLHASRNGAQQLNVDELIVDIDMLPLLDNEIRISEFKISGLFVGSQFSDQSLNVAGLDVLTLIQASAQSTAQPGEPQAAVASDDVSTEVRPPLRVSLEALALEDVRLCASAEQQAVTRSDLCLSWDALINKGNIDLEVADIMLLNLPGELSLYGLRIQDNLQQLSVLNWQSFTLADVQYEPASIELGRVNLQGLQLLHREPGAPAAEELPAHLQLAEFTVDDIHLQMEASTTVGLQRVAFSGIDALVLRDDKRMEIQKRIEQLVDGLQAFKPAPTSELPDEAGMQEAVTGETAARGTKTEAQTVVELQKLVVEGNSRIVYLDTLVQPQVEQRLENVSLSFGPINTAAIGESSNLDLSVDVNEFSKLSLQGWVKPLTEKLNMDVKLQVEGYDPLAVSPYVERALQYKIQRGQLNNTLEIVIEENQLDIDSELILEKFYLEDLKPEELAEGEKAQTIPVATAMNLLRDGDDRITIKLPITGDVADPSFSLSQVVGVVLKKALTQAVINYYTPFGLVNIASALADSATQLRFEPLLLTAGQAQPDKAHQQRLQQLADLLKAKQQLSLSFCPTVTGADALHALKLDKVPEKGLALTPEQQQQLRQLGIDRGKAIKSDLMGKNVAASQIILCQANVDITDMSAPEISISM